MQHKKKCCFFRYDGIFYCFNAMKRNVYIYTVKHLDLVDTLDSVSFDISKIFANPQTGVVGILYENFLNLYAPTYLEDMSLKWNKKLTYRFSVEIKDISFSAGGEYILTAGSKHLAIYKVKYNYVGEHSFDMEKLEEFYKVDVEEDIKECDVSSDSKYFATLGENSKMVFIWDFASLIKPPQEYEYHHDEEEKHIVNYALIHSNDVISFSFRENFWERIVNKFQPNSFITLDNEGYIRIWQENLLKEGMHFYTIATIYIEASPQKNLICYEWLNIKTQIQPDASYVVAKDNITPKPIFPYGVYENENLSVDWLLVSKAGDSIVLYKITGLRNVSNNANAIKEFEFTRDEIKSFRTLSFSWTSQDDVIGVVGQDHDNNMIKIQMKIMKEDIVQFIRTEGELNSGIYVKSSFNRHEGSLLTLTNNMALYHFHPAKRFMPDYYHKLSYSDSKVYELNKHLSKIKVSDMFSFKNFCFLFANSLEKLYLINLDQKTTENNVYFVDLYSIAPEIFSSFKRLQSTENCLRLLDSKTINDQIECSLSLLRLNNLKIIKMRFLLKEFLEHDFKTDQKVIQIPNNFISFQYITEYDFDENFLNYKTYMYKQSPQPELTFLAISEKFFYKIQTHGNTYTQSFKLKCPSRIIKYFGGSDKSPFYVYILDHVNNITFFTPEGQVVSRYQIKDLLSQTNEQIADIYNLKVSITPFDQRVFLITIEKYLFVVYLEFNQVTKIFNTKVLKRPGSNEIYMMKVPKTARGEKLAHKLYTDKSRNIIVVGGRKVKILTNGCFDALQFSGHQGEEENQNQLLADNLQVRLLRSKINLPHHHPDFLSEILVLDRLNLAEYILGKLVRTLRKDGEISAKFNVSIQKIFEIEDIVPTIQEMEETKAETDFNRKMSRKLSRRFSIDEDKTPITEEDISWLAKEIYNRDCTNLQPYESFILSVLIETMISNKENKRSLDDCAAIFIYYLKMFKMGQSHIGNRANKQKCLMTKDIVWALHSQQKDSLIIECIKPEEEDDLSWEYLRKLGIIIWFDNLEKIKDYIEKIARNEFRKTREASKVMLWYILLGKKNVLLSLCERDSKAKNIADFLKRDFNEQANKNAANKNADVLLSKKNYEMSIAFFLLGGSLSYALSVITDKLQDIQLALLACKLFETGREKPEYNKLLDEYFITSGKTTGDIFLSSIGYHLLGQHVNSVNCLYELKEEPEKEYQDDPDYTKKQCFTWPQKFEPALSSFHPSVMILANKLRGSVPVRRELQASEEAANQNANDDIFADFMDEDEVEDQDQSANVPKVELKEDLSLHVLRSMEYYIALNIPLLGLVFYLEHKDQVEFNQNLRDLLKQLYEKHLDLSIVESIEYEDWMLNFEKLNKRVKEISTFFPVKSDVLRSYCERRIKDMRSLKLTTSYFLSNNKYEQALEDVSSVALELQNVLFHISHRINFIKKEKHMVQNIVYVMSEISTGLAVMGEYGKFSIVRGQQIKHLEAMPSKEAHDEEHEKDVLAQTFNQNSTIIQFLLFAGLFELANSLSLPDLVVQIIELACKNLKEHATSQKPINWATQRLEIEPIALEILKASDNLIIKSHYSRNLRSLEFMRQVFKVYFNENPPEQEKGDFAKLLGEAIIKYLFAYTFLKRVGKIFGGLKPKGAQKHDTTKLSLERIYYGVNLFKKCNKKAFLIFLSKFRLNEQLTILEEVKDFLQNDIEMPGKVRIIPFSTLLSDKQILQKIEKNDLKKIILKIHYRIASTLLLRPSLSLDQNLEAEKVKILQTGFEICKLKNETIKAFCFNNHKNMKHELVVLSSKGIRKVSLLTNILYKTRLHDGLSVPEEEALTLIDKDNYIHDMTDEHLREIEMDSKDRPLSIKLAYHLLLDEKFQEQSKRRNSKVNLKQYEFHAFENIDGFIPPDAHKISSAKAAYDIHETNVVRSHPKLPIFCTGGKGIINTWSFLNLRVVNTLQSTHKEVITSIKFNNFGDKLGAIDTAGVMNLWKFNLRTPITKPIFTINHGSKNYLSDFCFLNDSSVFAHCSVNPKNQFSIVDILLPPKNNAILTEGIGGNQILYSPIQHMLLLANSRKGIVSCYDIRKGMTMKNIEVSREEVKSISLSCSNNVLIAGTSNSQVKLFSLNNFELINEVCMRTVPEKKAPYITDLEALDECIFASNSDGLLSFLTTVTY